MDCELTGYLENAFTSMNIDYKAIKNDKQILYRFTFSENEPFNPTVTLIIDELFSAEMNAYIAYGITSDKRQTVLEEINAVNDRFSFINVSLDKNNDIYSCQQFILAGSQRIMCKQIITNLIIFYDLHKRICEKIFTIING